SGGLLLVVFKDNTNQWITGFYNASDLSEIAYISLGHNELDLSGAVMGTGKLYLSFSGPYADTSYMTIINIPNHSVDANYALVGDADWGPMALGPGAIYHISDSTGRLYRMNISNGEVTETQSGITPGIVGGMAYVPGYGILATDFSGGTLYRLDDDGTFRNSWGIDQYPRIIAWDGYRFLVTSKPGVCPVSPSTGKLPSIIISGASTIAVSPDTELILVGCDDGVTSISVDGLEVLGSALTPFAINLIAPTGHATAFASAQGSNKIYLLK
ncbi:MAG: hypothetical protein ACP5QG_06310, partial [candidate division WOR-3 bacterium]